MDTNQDKKYLLKKITFSFFQRIPIRCFETELHEFIMNNSEEVFNNTVKHELNEKFPVKITYQKAFLKELINMLEKNSLEIDEEVYHHYLNLPTEINKTHYIHFPTLNNKFISIRESSNIISEGTTGLSIWQAGKVLAEYCADNKLLFEGKSILELGCGLGLTGLSVIFSCSPSQYFFSDTHDEVLRYLIHNIELNLTPESNFDDKKCDQNFLLNRNHQTTQISVINLSWENITSEMYHTFIPDIILAADVVYDSELFYPLCGVLKYFISRNKNVKIFFACTLRSMSTLEDFFSVLDGFNLTWTEMKTVTTWNSSFNCNCEVKIYSFQLKDVTS